jgi:two-component system, NarL family, sensor histidine kinase BarA
MDHNQHNSVDLKKTPTLYIEDDPIAFEVVKSFLKDICEIDWAGSGDEALRKSSEKNYRLILMDIHLPRGLNGIQLTKHFRNDNYYSKIPIIAVTAYAMAGEKEEILSNGCDDYISKPFTKKLLLDTIVKYIR